MNPLVLPSFSQAHIAEQCPPAFGDIAHYASETAVASLGTDVHAFAQAVHDGMDPTVAAGLVSPRARLFCQNLDVSKLPFTATSEAEVGYAINVETLTARALGKVTHSPGAHDYPGVNRAVEMPGTLDLRDIVGKHGFADDLKTGWGDVPEARVNSQLHLQAFAISRAHGLTSVTVALRHLRESGDMWTDEWTLDEWALEGVGARILALVAGIRKAREPGPLPFRLGAHCTYCPAVKDCPAHVAVARVAVADPEHAMPKHLTSADAAQAWVVACALQRLAGSMKERLKAYASQFLVPLPDGTVLGPVEEEKRALIPARAQIVLAAEYGAEVAAAAVEKSITMASITRALEGQPRGKGATYAKKKLADAQAFTITKRTTIEPHKREAIDVPG